MSDRADGTPSAESTSRLLFERSIAAGRQNTPLLIWLAVLVVTAVVIGRKASGEHIDTADIVLIVSSWQAPCSAARWIFSLSSGA